MSQTITIYRGSDRKIRIPTNLDLTLCTAIDVCFTTDSGKYHAIYRRKTGDIGIGSPAVANIDITDLVIGQEIIGANIPAGTKIFSIGVGSIVMTQNASGTATGQRLDFGNVSLVDELNGLIRVKLYGVDTASFKKGSKTVGLTFLVNGFTSKAVSDPVFDVQDDPC